MRTPFTKQLVDFTLAHWLLGSQTHVSTVNGASKDHLQAYHIELCGDTAHNTNAYTTNAHMKIWNHGQKTTKMVFSGEILSHLTTVCVFISLYFSAGEKMTLFVAVRLL